jgi:hypothetical protein
MKKKKTIDPELKLILTELEEVVMRLGFKVRYEKGDFEGGYCMLRDSHLIVVNNRNEMEKRISIVCKCVKQIGVNDIYVKPNLREIIETESARPKADGPGEETEKEPEEKIEGETKA